MVNETPVVASRAKRFIAFAIDQTILSILSTIVFVGVLATQVQPLSDAANAFFGDPLWSQAETLSSGEFDARLEKLLASPKVAQSVEALAHPFALAMGLSLLLSAIYYIQPTKKWGATLGKYWLKIKVSDLDGANTRPDWWQSSVRYFTFIGLGTFGGIVAILDLVVNKAFLPSNTVVDVLTMILSQIVWVASVVAIVMICARVDRRGLHDILARTIVYNVTSSKKEK